MASMCNQHAKQMRSGGVQETYIPPGAAGRASGTGSTKIPGGHASHQDGRGTGTCPCVNQVDPMPDSRKLFYEKR